MPWTTVRYGRRKRRRITSGFQEEPADFSSTRGTYRLNINSRGSQGLQAVQDCFQRNPDPKRPDAELLQLLRINLNRNDFEFNGEFYLQIKGTAMGKKFAPAYANIFMAAWEKAVLQTVPLQVASYFRFLDDLWGIWTYSLEDFNNFVDIWNNFNPSIKVKAHIHLSSVDFLDTTTFKGPGFIQTQIGHEGFFFFLKRHTLFYIRPVTIRSTPTEE